MKQTFGRVSKSYSDRIVLLPLKERKQAMKVLILGGTGVISRAITAELLKQNHELTLYNRGANDSLPFLPDVERLIGDRLDRTGFEAEMRKRSFDAVIDMICFNEEDARSTVRAFRDRVEQVVVTSSVAAYKRPYRSIPTVEASEELWDDPSFGYAWHKAEMERYLRPVIERKELNITLIRPSLTYGPGAANIGVLRQNYGLVHRIRQGKPLVMFGDGSTPWTWTFAPDLAKAYAGVLGNARTHGQAYHTCSEELHRWEDLYLEIGRIVGKEPKIVHIPSEILFGAAPNLCQHLLMEKTYPGLFDNSKARRDIPGFRCEITLRRGLESLLQWFETEANTIDPEKEALEDKLVAAHEDFAAGVKGIIP